MSDPVASGNGVVLQGTGGIWQVRLEDGTTVAASMRGRLKQDGRDQPKLCVGDRVAVETDVQGASAIHTIHPRHSQLARRAPGGAHGERVVVANLDQVLVVFAVARPEPHPRMLDRFLIIAEANGLAARVVVNKIDLSSEAAARERFAEHLALGYPFHFTSVPERRGLEALHDEVAGRISALTGPSGVGKSSLMNALFPGLTLRTAAISESVNKGRHTTVGAVLHPLPDGGYVADTPGLREVGLWGIAPSALASCFPEFRPVLDHCRFGDCTHLVEPGCGVREALAAGVVGPGRYESYVKLHAELTAG